jgi:hypothetical protein
MVSQADDLDYSLLFTMGIANNSDIPLGVRFDNWGTQFTPQFGADLIFDRVEIASGTDSTSWKSCWVQAERGGMWVYIDGNYTSYYSFDESLDVTSDWLLFGFNIDGIDESQGEFIGIDNVEFVLVPEPATALLFFFGGTGAWVARRLARAGR